ncbi:MAG: peptidoglycan-binding protein, partial [Candidatus Vogelbacteria bacterium]|nr:peptidoglycan-binding protein [Candidatus Vogelbacteria bacterium]
MKKIFVLALFAFSFILSNNSTLAQTTDSVTLRQLTVSEREKYEVLLREYGTLKQQLAELEARGSSWCHTFNTNLSIGMTGSEVTALQTALTKAGFTISATGNFDEVTAAAVSGFQLKYQSEILTPLGLTNPTGYFGPATRAVMNRLYGCGNQSPTTPSITVSSPTNNSSWTSTNGPVVQWSSQNIPASNTVTIQLLTPSGGSVPGFSNFTTANDGSESGRLANSTVASGWYYFRLSTLVNGQTVYGGSGAFQFTGASQTPLSTATTYSVTVGVKNVNTGVWIAGAAVRVTGNGLDRTLTTASNGQTSTEVPAGAYTLMVSAAGYQTQTQSITIVSSGYNWQPSLTPTAVTTTLTVTSPTSGSYAAGASLPVTWTWANIPSGTLVNVYLLDSNNSPNVGASGLVNTANDGSATLTLRSDAPAGRYRVRVAATVNGQLITGYGNWFSVTNSVVTPPPVTTYTLSRQINPIGAGSTIRDPNMTNYPAGTVVTITATPAAGYAFSHWGIDLSGSVNPTTITMNGNKTVSANFAVTPTTAAMRIRVKDSSTLAYLANANVTFRVDGAVIAYQTTDANGLTGSVDVAIGKSLYLDVSHTGYTPRTNYNSGTVPSSGGVRDA